MKLAIVDDSWQIRHCAHAGSTSPFESKARTDLACRQVRECKLRSTPQYVSSIAANLGDLESAPRDSLREMLSSSNCSGFAQRRRNRRQYARGTLGNIGFFCHIRVRLALITPFTTHQEELFQGLSLRHAWLLFPLSLLSYAIPAVNPRRLNAW